MNKNKYILLLVGLLFVFLERMACAAIMEIPLGDTGWSIFVGSDISDQLGVTVFGQDPSTQTVFLELDKQFTDFHGSVIQVRFAKMDSRALAYSRFVIVDEFIVNDTDSEWHGFHMVLVSDGVAGFDNSTVPDGDKLPNVTWGVFNGYGQLPTELNFDGGADGIVPNTIPSNYFRPGYISGDIVILADPNLEVGRDFLLQEYYSPEPTSLLLLLGLSWLGVRKTGRHDR